MRTSGHLHLEQVTLWPGQEWVQEEKAWRFVCLQSGPAYWLGEPPTRNFNPGEVVVCSPGAKMLVRASQLGDVVLHTFTFCADLIFGFFTLQEREFLERNGEDKHTVVRFLPSTHPLSRRFGELVAARATRQEIAVRAELFGLGVKFFFEVLQASREPPEAMPVQDQFEQIIGEMPDTEFIHYQAEDLAQLCHCSARHFTRLFRRRFGSSPRERQVQLRLQRAARLLLETERKVAEVAADSGYHSAGLFNALFKKRYGMSPTEWRDSERRSEGDAEHQPQATDT
jgi:AraC-like DNA-binding protein